MVIIYMMHTGTKKQYIWYSRSTEALLTAHKDTSYGKQC